MSTLRYLPHAAFNGQIVALSDVRVSALGDGFMFGYGLFETIKVVAGRLVFFEDHFARLRRSASALGLVLNGDERRLLALCERVVSTNTLEAGNLKVIVFQDEDAVSEIVFARSGLYPQETYTRGFRLAVETVTGRSALVSHKTLNYFDNIAAKRRVAAKGFDEPIFTDGAGLLFEGATTNIFIVKDGRVFTPPTDGRILPGVARGRVLRLLGEQAVETSMTLAQLRVADEVFVTNALLGVMPVSLIDGQNYDLTANRVTRKLAAELASGLAQSSHFRT